MKFLSLTAPLLLSLALISCAGKAKETAETDTSTGPLIPPPSAQQPAEAIADADLKTEQDNLTENSELSTESEKPASSTNNLTQSGGYVFRNPVDDLHSESDLDTPIAPTPPVSPTPIDDQSYRLQDNAADDPLVINP